MSSTEDKNKSIALVASLLVIAVVAIILYVLLEMFMLKPSGTELREGHKDEDYCRMVKLYLDTNGEEGYRDYRNIYYKNCLK